LAFSAHDYRELLTCEQVWRNQARNHMRYLKTSEQAAPFRLETIGNSAKLSRQEWGRIMPPGSSGNHLPPVSGDELS
jgi:hypothetical protein